MKISMLSLTPEKARIRSWSLLCLEKMAQFSTPNEIHILEIIPFVYNILAKFSFGIGKKLDIYVVHSCSYFNGSGKYQRKDFA